MLAVMTSSEMLSIVLGYAMMLIVPGPSLLIVVQASLATHRHQGLVTALGVAMGASLLVLALAFSTAYLVTSSTVVEAGRVVCILVLLIAAFRALRSGMRQEEAQVSRPSNGLAPFAMGLTTAMSNPLSLGFFGSAALSLPGRGDLSNLASLPLVVFVMAFAWYGLIGFVMARPRLNRVHRSLFRLLSIGSGIALVLFAGTMALSN
ncbi:threonine efflux protein [Devosia sp. UYZn731]